MNRIPIFPQEVYLLTHLRFAPADGQPRAGDIVLKLNPQLRADAEIWTCQNRNIVKTRDYAQVIAVTDMAVTEGFDYRAVCEGTATLSQAMFPYNEAGRVFQYTIEVSTDETNWARVVDAGKNGNPVTERGTLQSLQPTKARFVRVNMLTAKFRNAVLLQEVHVYEAGKPGPVQGIPTPPQSSNERKPTTNLPHPSRGRATPTQS